MLVRLFDSALGDFLAERGGRYGFLTGSREIGGAGAGVEGRLYAVADGVGGVRFAHFVQ